MVDKKLKLVPVLKVLLMLNVPQFSGCSYVTN